jgi:hypothetical protein
VHVYQLIAENTVEAKVCVQLLSCIEAFTGYHQVLEIQEKKKKLIKEVMPSDEGIVGACG